MPKIDRLRIEICGGIAAGKTSLSKLMSEDGIIPAVNECFNSNPFLESFYEDPAFVSFETEITFALQHYHDIKIATIKNNPIICDYSVFLDLAYADVTLKESEFKAFISVHDEIISQIGYPGVLIYLRCDPVILLNRIRVRQRQFEQGITVEYLSQVINALEKRIFSLKNVMIVEIDSDKVDFVEKDRIYLCDKLHKYLDSFNKGLIKEDITYI